MTFFPRCLALVCIAASAVGAEEPGAKPAATFDQVRAKFAEPDTKYAPFAFWFWDAPVDTAKARDIAGKLMSQRIHPGYAHPRYALAEHIKEWNLDPSPSLPKDEWLGPKWFEAFNASAADAKKKGFQLGFCDEYWWPSGQAAGRVIAKHPDLAAVSLTPTIIDVAPGEVKPLPASLFTVAAQRVDATFETNSANSPTSIRSATLKVIGEGAAFDWTAPATGAWRVYSFSVKPVGSVNYMDRRLAGAYITEALEPYAKNAGPELGRTIPGIFNDHEGSWGHKIAWSTDLDAQFKKTAGRELRPLLPLLLDEDAEGDYARLRVQWFRAVGDIYTDFFGELNDWARAKGMYFISNIWEENLLWQAIRVGNFMQAQRRVTFPGTDCLQMNGLDVSQFKETETVCEFEGRRLMTEMMGAGNWRLFSPTHVKQVSNALITWGVSHMVPHGVFTTRKFRNNQWAPDWLDNNPAFPWFHLWSDFARRSSWVNATTRREAGILLLNPMETVWTYTGWQVFHPAKNAGPFNTEIVYPRDAVTLAIRYRQTMTEMTRARLDYFVPDTHYLDQMTVTNGTLRRDAWTFRTVVLPPLKTLPRSVAAKLVAFCSAGGRVYSLGSLPDASPEGGAHDATVVDAMKKLESLPAFKRVDLAEPPGGVTWTVPACPELAAFLATKPEGLVPDVGFETPEFPLLTAHRVSGTRHFYWLANNTTNDQTARLRFEGVTGGVTRWDCESGTTTALPASTTPAGTVCELTFPALAGFWVVIDTSAKPVAATPRAAKSPWTIDVAGPWNVRVDAAAQPVTEFPNVIPDDLKAGAAAVKPLGQWSTWGLTNFSGCLDYTTTFDAAAPSGQALLVDLGKVDEAAEVWLNGKSLGQRYWAPHRFAIPTSQLRQGRNELRIRVANSAGNVYGMKLPAGLTGPVTIRTE